MSSSVFCEEEACAIPYARRYLIDYSSNIWSTIKNQQMRQFYNPNGYRILSLSWDHGPRRSFVVHQLVADAFIPNPDNLPCIDHIDRNPVNNHVTNLRRCTQSQNVMNQDSHSKTGYKGVYDDGNGNYRVIINHRYKSYRFGSYRTKEAAAIAYNREVVKLQGEFAVLNNV